MELGQRERIILFPGAIGAIVIVVAILLAPDSAVVGNAIIIAMFVGRLGPLLSCW